MINTSKFKIFRLPPFSRRFYAKLVLDDCTKHNFKLHQSQPSIRIINIHNEMYLNRIHQINTVSFV